MTDVLDVITNALHGWHNPSCRDCRMRALEVVDALRTAGYPLRAPESPVTASTPETTPDAPTGGED
jgi:hypothetical protein